MYLKADHALEGGDSGSLGLCVSCSRLDLLSVNTAGSWAAQVYYFYYCCSVHYCAVASYQLIHNMLNRSTGKSMHLVSAVWHYHPTVDIGTSAPSMYPPVGPKQHTAVVGPGSTSLKLSGCTQTPAPFTELHSSQQGSGLRRWHCGGCRGHRRRTRSCTRLVSTNA